MLSALTWVTSFFPRYNQTCLKLYWCLVDSGPFLVLTTCRILYVVLQLSATEVSDEAEKQVCHPTKPAVPLVSTGPWRKQAAAAPAQLPPPSQDPGWAEQVFPISLPCYINLLEQCSLWLPMSGLCVTADMGRRALNAHEDYSSNCCLWYSQAQGPHCHMDGWGAEGSQPPKCF